MDPLDLLARALVLLGATLIGLAAIGLIRLPDVYNRNNAVAKASSLGLICLLLGVMAWMPHPLTVLTLIPAVLLQLLTSPISGFAIGRAAYRTHAPFIEQTRFEDPTPHT
jgi:multicomponent Na+:H+ antiporter subunit G